MALRVAFTRILHIPLAGGLALAVSATACGTASAHSDARDPGVSDVTWPSYGGDPGTMRYSAARQIAPGNVTALAPAWRFELGPASVEATGQSASGRPPRFEATPIMVDGRLFFSTPLGRVFALDPATGRQLWEFDAHVDQRGDYGDFTNRGVSSWVDRRADANAACRRTIFLATIDARLIALDALTGQRCPRFGTDGTVDLVAGVRNPPEYPGELFETSPPAVVDDDVVVGSGVADNNRTNAPSGVVRAFDARTGRLAWSWDPVPRSERDPAWKSWVGPRAHDTGAANAWSVLSVDTARHLVFVPTGSASTDYFGGERLGDNRYANSITALRAGTGEVVWSFQLVHHDLWDYDVAASPALVPLRVGASTVPAVLQTGKTSQLFALDRATGSPLFPVIERRVPTSDVPGEVASPTQPFSSLPALSPLAVSSDSLFGVTARGRAECRELLRHLRNDGIYTPPTLGGSLIIPSNIGGPQWGGLAFDPVRQIAIVPVNRFAAMVQLIPRTRYDSTANEARWEYAPMTGTPYVMRRKRFESASGWPCTPVPAGALVAVDMTRGAVRWQVPLGDATAFLEADSLPPVAEAAHWGTSVRGGAIVTASGLAFISATSDAYFRAFDVRTGAELWRTKLSAPSQATPMTYQLARTGKQYVVVAVGGDRMKDRGGSLVAYALP